MYKDHKSIVNNSQWQNLLNRPIFPNITSGYTGSAEGLQIRTFGITKEGCFAGQMSANQQNQSNKKV